MSQRYTSPSGTTLRIVGNNLLVRIDDRPKATRGGILIPDNVLADMYATGEVLAVGTLTGPRAEAGTPIPGIDVGDRVLFVRLLERTDSNPRLKQTVEDDVLRIRADDVLLVLDAEDLKRVQ